MNQAPEKPSAETVAVPAKAAMQAQISAHLMEKYGPVIGSEGLWQILSFKSRQAFDRSVQRRLTKLPLFRPEGREGVYVLAPVLAAHLVDLAEETQIGKEAKPPQA